MTSASFGHLQVSRIAVGFLFLGLFLSGLAGMVNESVWQRALRIYLGGCEGISSMIVVLVFMLGLGAGSLFMGLTAHLVRNTLRLLAIVELALFLVNVIIAALLAFEVGESIYSFQRFAVSLGVPLRLTYGIFATAALCLPCFLMGITMPLVSEVAQRQLRCTGAGFVTVLFLANTFGAVLGGGIGGFLFMPYFGQRASLHIGAFCNLVAAMIFLTMYLARYRGTDDPPAGDRLEFRRGKLAPAEILGFWLGFLSLAYEMYLFRMTSLAHQPLPYNFSVVLCYYLLFWSIGLFLAPRIRECIPTLLALSGLLVSAMPLFFMVDRFWLHPTVARLFPSGLPLVFSGVVYSLPCVSFGCLFGQVLARNAANWGKDVGRYYALNTFGSCLGIVVMTMVGFEINHIYGAILMASGYIGVLLYARRKMEAPVPSPGARRLSHFNPAWIAAFVLIMVTTSLLQELTLRTSYNAYFGRDGVVEVLKDGSLFWDGLWHSSLAVKGNYVGTNNWLLGVVPILCHGGGAIDDALVIGLGTGITAATLAECGRVKSVDVYEINQRLKSVLRDYPDGTLHVANNGKIKIRWQDGRAGLALNNKRYDLITQQPFYLKQSGSSILLSKEYMELVKRRLKPGGVFCIYCNAEGNDEQALLVRKTAAAVFAHCESFGEGYMIVASMSPFVYHSESLADILGAVALDMQGVNKLKAYLDVSRLEWEDCPYLLTDNHPLVEYPGVLTTLLANRGRHSDRTR